MFLNSDVINLANSSPASVKFAFFDCSKLNIWRWPSTLPMTHWKKIFIIDDFLLLLNNFHFIIFELFWTHTESDKIGTRLFGPLSSALYLASQFNSEKEKLYRAVQFLPTLEFESSHQQTLYTQQVFTIN